MRVLRWDNQGSAYTRPSTGAKTGLRSRVELRRCARLGQSEESAGMHHLKAPQRSLILSLSLSLSLSVSLCMSSAVKA